jgi:hypothetical protein
VASETSVDTQRTTRRYIPEDSTLHNHRCENLKSYLISAVYLFVFPTFRKGNRPDTNGVWEQGAKEYVRGEWRQLHEKDEKGVNGFSWKN